MPTARFLPWLALAFALALVLSPATHAQTILGSTGSYAVMAGSTVTINGATPTTITGDFGRANQAGAGTLNLTGTAGVMTSQNQTDFLAAFNGLAAMTPTTNLTGSILGTTPGAVTLTPGVYKFTSTAQLTGNLILDAQNQANAVWVFQIGSTLTTAAASSVTFVNQAANSVATNGLFWQVGSTTTFGANTAFEGNVLGGTTFTLGAGATIAHGRLLSGTGSTITLDSNTIDFIAADSGYSGGLMFDGGAIVATAIPEPAAVLWLAPLSALGLALWRRRARRPVGA